MSWARIGVARQSRIMHGVKKRGMKKRSMGGGLSLDFFVSFQGEAFERYQSPVYIKEM